MIAAVAVALLFKLLNGRSVCAVIIALTMIAGAATAQALSPSSSPSPLRLLLLLPPPPLSLRD